MTTSLDDDIRRSKLPRQFGSAIGDICEPRIRRIWEYWDSRRQGRVMPARRDIDPLDIPSDLLPGIVLTEVLSEDPWLRYRLVGTAQAAFRGRDPTGQPVQGNYTTAHLGLPPDDVMLNYRIVIERKIPVYVSNPVSGAAPDGSSMRQSPIRASSTVLMPLSNDGTKVDMVLCFTDFEDP